jgi:hypothetical protein
LHGTDLKRRSEVQQQLRAHFAFAFQCPDARAAIWRQSPIVWREIAQRGQPQMTRNAPMLLKPFDTMQTNAHFSASAN